MKEGGMEVYRRDICDQVAGLEAIPRTTMKRGGLLHNSGPVLLRGPRIEGEVLGWCERGRRVGISSFFNTAGRALYDCAIRLVAQ